MSPPRNSVECTICGRHTYSSGNGLCDRCWELNTRIESEPELATRILANMEGSMVAELVESARAAITEEGMTQHDLDRLRAAVESIDGAA